MYYKTKNALIGGIIIFIAFALLLGVKNAWFIFGNLYFIPFVIVGIIMSLLGIHNRKFGSIMFGAVSLILALIGMKS